MSYSKEECSYWFSHSNVVSPVSEELTKIHDAARFLALLILETCPARKESDLALESLQCAVSWVNTSLTRG